MHGHCYAAPYALIGRQLEVRETKDRIDLYQGPRLSRRTLRVIAKEYFLLSEDDEEPRS